MIIFILIVTIIILVVFCIIKREMVFDVLVWIIDQMRIHPLMGALCLIGCFIVAILFFIPGFMIVMATGFAFAQAYSNFAVVMLAGTAT